LLGHPVNLLGHECIHMEWVASVLCKMLHLILITHA